MYLYTLPISEIFILILLYFRSIYFQFLIPSERFILTFRVLWPFQSRSGHSLQHQHQTVNRQTVHIKKWFCRTGFQPILQNQWNHFNTTRPCLLFTMLIQFNISNMHLFFFSFYSLFSFSFLLFFFFLICIDMHNWCMEGKGTF
jgi:hypothetical protein